MTDDSITKVPKKYEIRIEVNGGDMGDLYSDMEDLIADELKDEGIDAITIIDWFLDGLVEHLGIYISDSDKMKIEIKEVET